MEKVRNANNVGDILVPGIYCDKSQNGQKWLHPVVTVQQGLCRWYNLFTNTSNHAFADPSLFPVPSQSATFLAFQKELEIIPSLIIEEFSSTNKLNGDIQYIRLVQALLVNISDELFNKKSEAEIVYEEIEKALLFLQNFFYQNFDRHYRLTQYNLRQYHQQLYLKLDYWKIKLNNSPLTDAVKESIEDKMNIGDNTLTFHQKEYLNAMFNRIESARSVLTETFLREMLLCHNFNSLPFAEFEIEAIQRKMRDGFTYDQIIELLYEELKSINKLKWKAGVYFEQDLPSLKQQLNNWIVQEIKNHEAIKYQKPGKEFVLEIDSKIQTSLSVAKLAVLIRLLVVDKIIINKSVAPMLRTVAKLCTTLQKDEISFGSLETKYHAPDKATLNIMKEMMQKWAGLTAKL